MSMFSRSDQTKSDPASPDHMQTTAVPESTGQRLNSARDAQPSQISKGLKIIGDLESDGDIQIDGTIHGDVRARRVTIGAGAELKGSVFAESVQHSGRIEGKIESREVTIIKDGRLEGDVIHESLQIEAGAYIDGHCRPTFGKDSGGSEKTKGSKAADAAKGTDQGKAEAPTTGADKTNEKDTGQKTAGSDVSATS